jgi:pantothenate kinase type III
MPMTTHQLLLIDAGNSALKFQCHLMDDATHASAALGWQTAVQRALTAPVHRIENAKVSESELLALWKSKACAAPDVGQTQWHLCWSSVGPVAIQAAIQAAYQQLSGKPAPVPIQSMPHVVLGPKGEHQLINRYETPAQLGVDRWVSAVGWTVSCVNRDTTCHMIVSAGTATTVDIVRVDPAIKNHAAFLGGWILPGIGLMNDALRRGTRDLDYVVDTLTHHEMVIPNQSQAAIRHGIGLAQTGFIHELVRQHGVSKIWVHGGFGPSWCAAAQSFRPAHKLDQLITPLPGVMFAGLMALADRRMFLAE